MTPEEQIRRMIVESGLQAVLNERKRCVAIVYDHYDWHHNRHRDLTQLDKDINNVLTQIVAAIKAEDEG